MKTYSLGSQPGCQDIQVSISRQNSMASQMKMFFWASKFWGRQPGYHSYSFTVSKTFLSCHRQQLSYFLLQIFLLMTTVVFSKFMAIVFLIIKKNKPENSYSLSTRTCIQMCGKFCKDVMRSLFYQIQKARVKMVQHSQLLTMKTSVQDGAIISGTSLIIE